MAEVNFQNRTLYHGDNLDFLRGMNSETVHLIATDPPFNKNRDFQATPNSLASGARFQDRWSWERDVHEEWMDSIKDDWPGVWEVIDAANVSYGRDMGAFLCWLGVRIMEMRRVLRQDGSLYLHIDHTAHAYVKALMDGVFGHRNFRNEIIWFYKTGGVSKRWFGRKHDTILFYSKSNEYKFTLQKEKSYLSHRYGFSNVDIQEDEHGIFNMVTMRDVWDIPALRGNQPEATGYPTQKPLALYERMIRASSSPGDIVLDPFCGCATTPIAAERLDRQWVGIDIWEDAYQTVLDRLEQEQLAILNEDADGEQSPRRLLTFGDVTYSKAPPERTDDNEVAAPSFSLKMQRPIEPWQKITHRQMVNVLVKAQGSADGVICAGCGRVLEKEFMEIDHIMPKSDRGENHIMNRILLCRPCNGRKRDNFTLRGLVRENKKRDVAWMRDEARAQIAQSKATEFAEWVRDNFQSSECQELIRQD